jgi:AcrR family transcriptional regulator
MTAGGVRAGMGVGATRAGTGAMPAGAAQTGGDLAVGVGVGLPRAQVAEIQRSRLLAAAVAVIDEHGYGAVSVGQIAARARVSRRTFYDLFANREECVAAVLDDAVERVRLELAAADLAGMGWRERVRTGLWTILSFLDRDPPLARLCVVHTVQGGPSVVRRREAILLRLAAAVDEGRYESARGSRCGPLTAEGLVGAAFMIVHARLRRRERTPLSGLLGELMGLIVLPYLGAAVAQRERSRPLPAPPPAPLRETVSRRVRREDPLGEVPMRLTYRTARVLEGIAELGARKALPSNREVADYAGIHDPGQVSKLLVRLQRLGLLANGSVGHRKGKPNAWTLTVKGERVARSIREHAAHIHEREVV